MEAIETLLGHLITEGLLSGIQSILRITMLLIPVFILIEFARYYNVLEAISKKMRVFTSLIKLPIEAAFPLLAGLSFGIVYGAALIIESANEGVLKKRDLILIGVFLSISHSLIEDTIIVTAMGANAIVVASTRFIVAILITRLVAAIIDRYLPALNTINR